MVRESSDLQQKEIARLNETLKNYEEQITELRELLAKDNQAMELERLRKEAKEQELAEKVKGDDFIKEKRKGIRQETKNLLDTSIDQTFFDNMDLQRMRAEERSNLMRQTLTSIKDFIEPKKKEQEIQTDPVNFFDGSHVSSTSSERPDPAEAEDKLHIEH